MNSQRSHFEEEMSIIPAGWAVAAGLCAVGVEILFHVLVPRWSHHDLPPEPWWAIIGITAAVFMAAMVLLLGYIYADAKRRGMNAILWTLLIILIPKPIGFIAYFLLRKPLLLPCPKCGASVQQDFHFCPNCRCALGPTCLNCGRSIGAGFACCPYCGKPVGNITPPSPAAG